MMFWDVLVLALVFSLVGYMRGREDGRAAERRDVRFTPVDKLEPREGYEPHSHYCPPLRDPRWEVERAKPVRAPSDFIQGITKGGDVYRYYDVEDL